MNTRPITKLDFAQIVRVIDHWWGGPTSALAHPMFFYQLGRLARVVEDEGQMVGFLLGFRCPDEAVGYVHLVGIHPGYRRRGVARLLYESFEQDCQREGCASMKAITTLGNEGSVRFHAALGWSQEEVADYAGPDRPRVVFTKELAPVAEEAR
ncbi:GNAT family N-acetyltransferase [Chondromyces apiculatus]|uniref:GNAT family N-acetyltransferase n=1 Tax=Chondromyces apiculatus TaxID=51 RepID=UPI0005C545B1|nr:GNAT family N-acetyltransferase [Chondromyces apiculatus]